LKIHQVYTHSELRNFTYIIELEDRSAIVIDPWNAELVDELLAEKQLSLTAIINTHEHWDHIQGNLALVEEHGCEVWAHKNGQGKIPALSRTLKTDELIALDNKTHLRVLDTPGHTEAHLCFVVVEQGKDTAIFTGDTLFNAGVGHCRSGGNAEVLYHTVMEQFYTLADQVVVYPGHDYLENNLQFSLSVEPENRDAQQWLKDVIASNVAEKPLTTTISDEKKINTFFRLSNVDIRKNINAVQASEKEVFVALRALRDQW
jgi:hydroxyacylglutathione hydrolase